MKKIFVLTGVGMALCSAVALADPDPAKPPLANAIETVTEQSLEHPGNKGLDNAVQRLQENARRQQEKRLNHPPGQNKAEASDRVQTAERVDRVEKAERPERPERAERPDRSARAGIDRPVPPGHSK